MDEKRTEVLVAYEDEVSDPVRPEKNLLLAILISALNDLSRKGRLGRQAQEFFLNDDDNYIFSFRAICEHLEIDPNQVLLVTGLVPGHKIPKDLPKSLAVLR
jgi:hypothetical protein